MNIKPAQKQSRAISRTQIMDIAKILRNATMAKTSKEAIIRDFARYFDAVDRFFDHKMFINIASGALDADFRTEMYSMFKEKENGEV